MKQKISDKLFSAVTEKLEGLLPDDSPSIRDEFNKNLKVAVQGAISRLDLVTREEFDAQAIVLQRTRSMIEELEKQVTELEQRLADQP
ncbi:MAG: accessory factor UbiK family protein [Pseudomonadales bacterium]|nr:accessory factor UbiK family protein [Pseudomonadales bacterium]